jgi:hypothetical protein
MSDNPYSSPASTFDSPFSQGFSAGLDFGSVAPLCYAAGWLKFLGIVNIVAGVIYCLTIIGLVIGWLPIWLGVLLNRASDSLRAGYEGQDGQRIHIGMDSLALAVKIVGVLAIIGLAFNVLYLGFVVLVVIGGLAGAMHG